MALLLAKPAGFPPVLTPASPSGALDYEERLGILVPIALIAERIWCGVSEGYAATWPARFFATIRPNQDLAAVIGQAETLTLQAMPTNAHDWQRLGEQFLVMLAHAPMS